MERYGEMRSAYSPGGSSLPHRVWRACWPGDGSEASAVGSR
jgi:hypothetical protein